jgi:hypothetical protein
MGIFESEIDHFVMAITSAKATVQHAAPAKIDEQGVIEMAQDGEVVGNGRAAVKTNRGPRLGCG